MDSARWNKYAPSLVGSKSGDSNRWVGSFGSNDFGAKFERTYDQASWCLVVVSVTAPGVASLEESYSAVGVSRRPYCRYLSRTRGCQTLKNGLFRKDRSALLREDHRSGR